MKITMNTRAMMTAFAAASPDHPRPEFRQLLLTGEGDLYGTDGRCAVRCRPIAPQDPPTLADLSGPLFFSLDKADRRRLLRRAPDSDEQVHLVVEPRASSQIAGTDHAGKVTWAPPGLPARHRVRELHVGRTGVYPVPQVTTPQHPFLHPPSRLIEALDALRDLPRPARAPHAWPEPEPPLLEVFDHQLLASLQTASGALGAALVPPECLTPQNAPDWYSSPSRVHGLLLHHGLDAPVHPGGEKIPLDILVMPFG